MYDKIEDVLSWLIVNSVEKFKVLQAGIWEDGKMEYKAILSFNDDSKTIDTKRQEFLEAMRKYGAGEYIIKQTDGKGSAECKLKIGESSKNNTNQSNATQFIGAPEGYISKTELTALLDKRDAIHREEVLSEKLKNVEEELKEARKIAKENGGAMTDFFKELLPLARPFVQGLLAKKMPSQIGFLENNQPIEHDIDVTEEEFTIIVNSINQWKKADADYLSILERLPEFTSNPMYNTAKEFILKS